MHVLGTAIAIISIVIIIVVSLIANNVGNNISADYNAKLKNIVDQVNSAQYYEYNFDKKQYEKTKKLSERVEKSEKQINNSDISLNSLQASEQIDVGKSWMQKDGTAMLGGALSVGGTYDPHEVNKWGWKAFVQNGSKGPNAVIAHRDGLGMHVNTVNRDPNKWALELHNGSGSMFRVHNDGKVYTSGGIQHTKSDPGSMLEKNYGRDADRYGIGQWPQGATRVYAATAYPGTVSLSLAGANNTFDDALTVSKDRIDVRKRLVLSDSSSLCINPANCINKSQVEKLKKFVDTETLCVDGSCITKDEILYIKSLPQQIALLKTCGQPQATQDAQAALGHVTQAGQTIPTRSSKSISVYNIASDGSGNINKWFDYDYIFRMCGLGVPYYFIYNNKLYRITFNNAENFQIRNTTFAESIDGGLTWRAPSPGALPTYTAGAQGGSFTVVEAIVNVKRLSIYNVGGDGFGNVNKWFDYSVILKKCGLSVPYYFGYSGKLYRIFFNNAENFQIRNTTFHVSTDGGDTWQFAAANAFPTYTAGSQGGDFSIQEVSFNMKRISVYNVNGDGSGNTNKWFDYAYILRKRGIGFPYYFGYSGKLYRAVFNAAENSQIRNTTFSESTDGGTTWRPPAANSFPTYTSGSPGGDFWVQEVAYKTKRISLYNIGQTGNLNKWFDYDYIFKKCGLSVPYYFGFKNNIYRIVLNGAENFQIRNTSFLESTDGGASWRAPSVTALPTYTGGSPSGQFMIEELDYNLRRISVYNVNRDGAGNVNKWFDYNYLFSKYGLTKTMFFGYNGRMYRLKFNNAENSQIRNTTFAESVDGGASWRAPADRALPTYTGGSPGGDFVVQEVV